MVWYGMVWYSDEGVELVYQIGTTRSIAIIIYLPDLYLYKLHARSSHLATLRLQKLLGN